MNGAMRKIQTKANASASFKAQVQAMKAQHLETMALTEELAKKNAELERSISLEGLTQDQCALEGERYNRLRQTERCNFDTMCSPVCESEFCSSSLTQPLGANALDAMQKITFLLWQQSEAAYHHAKYCCAALHLQNYDEDMAACVEYLNCHMAQLKEELHPEGLSKVKFVLAMAC